VISSKGDVAWISDSPTMKLAKDYPCRFTAVLVRVSTNNVHKWLFAQAHLSMGVRNEDLCITGTEPWYDLVPQWIIPSLLQAQSNQPRLILGMLQFLKEELGDAGLIERWLMHLRERFSPLWRNLYGKEGIDGVVRAVATNFLSFGARLDSLTNKDQTYTIVKDQTYTIVVTWNLSSFFPAFGFSNDEGWNYMEMVADQFVHFVRATGLLCSQGKKVVDDGKARQFTFTISKGLTLRSRLQ
jgi:hypothetical protein